MKQLDPNKVTILARMALALLSAESVLPLLSGHPGSAQLLAEFIDAGWSWIKTRTPDPGTLYTRYKERMVEAEYDHHGDERRLTAWLCGLDSHYYTIWKAQGVAHKEQPGVECAVGEDIAEVDESVLETCLERAVKASMHPDETEAWIDGLIERMERDFPLRADDRIGVPPDRGAFPRPPTG